MKAIFFGTSPFAATLLKRLFASKTLEIVAVVTRPDRPKGRGKRLSPSAVKEAAASFSTPIYTPEKASTPSMIEELKKYESDLFIVIAYGEILSPALLQVPKQKAINVHPSLLPLYRGAAPIERTLFDGCGETALSIIEMVKELDAGDILYQKKLPLDLEITCGELYQKFLLLAEEGLLATIEQIESHSLFPIAQNGEEATYAQKIKAEEREIHWGHDALSIHNQIRALSPRPGAYGYMGEEKKRVKILKSRYIEDIREVELKGVDPGAHIVMQDPTMSSSPVWWVRCGRGAIEILELQAEGKSPLSVEVFLRGRLPRGTSPFLSSHLPKWHVAEG